jgi:hypothetical protein
MSAHAVLMTLAASAYCFATGSSFSACLLDCRVDFLAKAAATEADMR